MFQIQLFHKVFCGMANCVDPDHTAPSGTVWSGSALFTCKILSAMLVYKTFTWSRVALVTYTWLWSSVWLLVTGIVISVVVDLEDSQLLVKKTGEENSALKSELEKAQETITEKSGMVIDLQGDYSTQHTYIHIHTHACTDTDTHTHTHTHTHTEFYLLKHFLKLAISLVFNVSYALVVDVPVWMGFYQCISVFEYTIFMYAFILPGGSRFSLISGSLVSEAGNQTSMWSIIE